MHILPVVEFWPFQHARLWSPAVQPARQWIVDALSPSKLILVFWPVSLQIPTPHLNSLLSLASQLVTRIRIGLVRIIRLQPILWPLVQPRIIWLIRIAWSRLILQPICLGSHHLSPQLEEDQGVGFFLAERLLLALERSTDFASYTVSRKCGRRQQRCVFKLKQGSSKVMVTLVGCCEQIAPYGQLVLEGIPVRGLVNTGASVSCLAHSTWWQHRATWRHCALTTRSCAVPTASLCL